jgi:3-ketosteroid 9alpha-monooxygenase subunit A
VLVPFTWKVTRWFMVGWSPEFPIGEVRPLHYFGEDLVAYRDERGELHVLDAHCKHLGAHIGHGGTVVGDCVQCPFHRWRWGPDGNPEDLALRFHSHLFGLGGAISVFEGAQNHRLIFTCTPVDDECSDLFYSIWWPRIPGDDSDVPHGKLREAIEKQFLSTVFDDLQIWRYQKYVEHPTLSKVDAKGYMALRKWATQFYEVPA